MEKKLSRNKQVRPMNMTLAQLKRLLARREKGVLFIKFLISQRENV